MNRITSNYLAGISSDSFLDFELFTEDQKNTNLALAQRNANSVMMLLNFQKRTKTLDREALELRNLQLEELEKKIGEVEKESKLSEIVIKERIANQKIATESNIKSMIQPSTSQNTGGEILEKILEKSTEMMENNNKILLEMKKDRKLFQNRFEEIEIAVSPFIWKAIIYKETPKSFQNDLFIKDMQSLLEELKKIKMTGVYKFALQIDILFKLIQNHNLDIRRVVSAISSIFDKGQVYTLMESKLTDEFDRIKEILKRLFERHLSNYNKTSYLFISKMVKHQSMEDNESINSWLNRYRSCIRFLDKTHIKESDQVKFFVAGISNKWKNDKLNAMDLIEIQEKTNLDFYIPEKEVERIVVVKANKNNSNYSHSYNFPHSNKNKKNVSDESIYSIYNEIKNEISREKEQKLEDQKEKKLDPRKKLFIEMNSSNNKTFKFLVDSGSPIHVIRKETLERSNMKYFEKEINTFSGAAINSKIDIIGTCKIFFRTGENKFEPIKFLVAKNIAVDILSWQRLAETFGKVMWVESIDRGRLIAIGSTQFTVGSDGIYRPLKKIDMKKVLQKIDDSKENHFELENNQFQLSDPVPVLNQTIQEQRKEIQQLKEKVQQLEEKENVEGLETPKEKEPFVESKTVAAIEVTETKKEEVTMKVEEQKVEEKPRKENTITFEFIDTIETSEEEKIDFNHQNKKEGIDKDQLEEKIDKCRERLDQFKKESLEDLLNSEKEEKRQEEEFLEEEKEKKGNPKEELRKLWEEIDMVRKVTKTNKAEPFKHELSREQRKKQKKEQKEKDKQEQREKENIIGTIMGLSESQKEEIFEYTRKVAKFDPNKHFQNWKEELEKGMFSKDELYQIWKEMKEESKFKKEDKPWLNQFDDWSEHILRNLQCTPEQKKQFKEGIKKLIDIPQPTFKQTFENNDGIGVDIEIDPKDYIKEPIWYMMQNKVEAAKSIIQGWKEAGYIEEIDEKEAKCIVNLVVQIKEGKVRVCMDYSKQNKHVKNDYGSFLSVDDVIDRLNPDHKVGFVIDLKGAFHNVLLSEETKKLCCFHFEGKVYCFKVLFFGISCGPFLFNEFIRKRLGELKDILKYIDDLICTKKTTEELLESFLRLVELLVKYKIAISPEKLQFGPRLKILGQYWEQGKLKMDINKLIALRYVTVIDGRRTLEVNLGMFRFIAKFTEGLNEKLQYFYKKTKETVWSWTKADAERLIKIWLEIESQSVLWTLDPNKEVVLRTDAATKNGIGFSILQYDEYGFERYIVHYSKALTDVQKYYSPIELEAYTIILALERFYKYFIGRKFRIETDAKSLVNIFNQVAEEKASKRIWRWTYILMQFQFYVVHIRGIDNQISDWMSKHPVDLEKFSKYLQDLYSKEDHEQMNKFQEEMEKELKEDHGKEDLEEPKDLDLGGAIDMVENTINMIQESTIQENEIKEGGDNYKSPTWTLIFIFHNILKKYMGIEEYEKHSMEIGKLQLIDNDEEREKKTYLYILNKVVHDPCPIKNEVKLGTEEDGLNRANKWGTLNFVNCPYSMELLEEFIKRCIEEKYKNGKTSVLLISFKYSGYIQKLLFKEPVQWDTLSILPSISFGKENKGRTFFPAMLLVEFDGNKRNSLYNTFSIDNLKMRKGIIFRIRKNHLDQISVDGARVGLQPYDDMPLTSNDHLVSAKNTSYQILEKENIEEKIMEINEKEEQVETEPNDEFDSEEIDDKIDLNQFDGYNPGFNENLQIRFEQEEKMFDPKIEMEGVDAYESIVRCMLENKELTEEMKHPRNNLVRKQAEHYIKHHQIVNDRLCYVDPKRLDKFNKGVRFYVRVADRYKIFRIAHELNGHLTIPYVMNYAQDYWWPNMYTHLEEKIESCYECQRFKKSREQDKVINTTPFYEPFQCGHIDLIGKLPGKYKYGFVYSDHCTKYTIAVAIKEKNMDRIADIIIRDIYYRIGFVELMVHDRGSEFLNKVMDAIFMKLGTRVRMTSVRHSASNMVERKNKTIGQMIRCLVYDHHENWYKFLPEVVFAMNTHIPKGLHNSPFELTFGRKPWTLLDLVMDNKTKHSEKNVNKWYSKLKYWIATNKALEWELRKKNQKTAVQDRIKVNDIVKIAGEELYYNAGSKKFQPFQSGPYKVLQVANGSALLKKIISDGEKEKTITAPTYKLTEFKMPKENPEMPQIIEDSCPIEIVEEVIDSNNGSKKYSVEVITLGVKDLETWTEDEFEKPEFKFLLDEWNRKKEKEKKLEQIYSLPTTVKRKIKEILEVELDENGKAMFKCVLVNKLATEPQWLAEKTIFGSKIIIDNYMKKNGYKRGKNDTWNKVDPNTTGDQISKN